MLRHTAWTLQSGCFRCTGSEIVNRRFGRDELIRFLAQRPAGRVALEACGSGHWWARKIKAAGHEVVLLHAKFIRPFVQTNKTDAADARAIWTAVQQPEMRTVAVKTEDQQAMLGLHRMRSLLVKCRTMQVNQLRGLLYEFGATFRAGRLAGLAEIRARMAELEEALPGTMIDSLQEQLRRIDGLEQDIDRLEKRIGAWQKDPLALDLKARRLVLAHAVDPWRAIGDVPRQGTDDLADKHSSTAPCQRGGGSLGPQDGTNGVGDSGSRSGVSEGLRQREVCVAH